MSDLPTTRQAQSESGSCGSPQKIMERLRESTRELHNQAEGHEFQKLLGGGKVAVDQYITYLEQLLVIHRTLAQELEKAGSRPVEAIVEARHTNLDSLHLDLGHFQKSPETAEPLPSTRKFLEELKATAQADPAALLGYLYVLEGSTNGARFMARTLREGLALPQSAGATYFDRYGPSQREYWMDFKARMNELELSPEQQEKIIETAKATFQIFFDMGEEILERAKT